MIVKCCQNNLCVNFFFSRDRNILILFLKLMSPQVNSTNFAVYFMYFIHYVTDAALL